MKRTNVPLGDVLTKAIALSSITGNDAEPFHIRVEVSEPENPQSPYKGAFEEWWASPQQWRREVTAVGGMHQVIVVSGGTKTEQDAGDYFPLWLRSFEAAILDPVPNPKMWDVKAQIEQVIMPNGDKSDPCARSTSQIGSGERLTTSYANVCFDNEGRLKFIGSPRYSMNFSNYVKFSKVQVPSQLWDSPEPGTNLNGVMVMLEKLSTSNTLFTPMNSNDCKFDSLSVDSAQLELLTSANGTIIWPPAHSGVLRGHVAMYVSVDSTGQVREAWPLGSDNAGLEDPARAQVMQWKIASPLGENSHQTQIDGGLSFSFATTLGDALPDLTDAEVRRLVTNLVDPEWPKQGLSHGQLITTTISVNERGELTGYGFTKVPPAAQGALMKAIPQWKFRPLERNGKPQYFHGTIEFVIP